MQGNLRPRGAMCTFMRCAVCQVEPCGNACPEDFSTAFEFFLLGCQARQWFRADAPWPFVCVCLALTQLLRSLTSVNEGMDETGAWMLINRSGESRLAAWFQAGIGCCNQADKADYLLAMMPVAPLHFPAGKGHRGGGESRLAGIGTRACPA